MFYSSSFDSAEGPAAAAAAVGTGIAAAVRGGGPPAATEEIRTGSLVEQNCGGSGMVCLMGRK